ncbi:MAG: DNA repair protein RadA, partial [Lachnospiraceae bacterium]|nr:DNA repair protein RadA [Lachnospiraceae bacterium]
IDSIQTISQSDIGSAPGSISQVRECTMRIMRLCKEKNLTVFVVGHINKEGSIAGPKVLEHMVDCVLYFEGERSTSFRILRAAKNRFGSTNEIGVFEMADHGLSCVENPSEMLLSGRPENCPGTCVACVIEGTRPILAEVQALVTPSAYNAARRSNGVDYNRAAMLLAVLEKRGGLSVAGCDSYINVIGGLTLEEPAADLATALAVASSFLDRPLGADLAAIGEVGLSGEIRSVSALNQRLSEISRLGFRRCVVPAHRGDEARAFPGLKLIPVRNISEAIAAVLARE